MPTNGSNTLFTSPPLTQVITSRHLLSSLTSMHCLPYLLHLGDHKPLFCICVAIFPIMNFHYSFWGPKHSLQSAAVCSHSENSFFHWKGGIISMCTFGFWNFNLFLSPELRVKIKQLFCHFYILAVINFFLVTYIYNQFVFIFLKTISECLRFCWNIF